MSAPPEDYFPWIGSTESTDLRLDVAAADKGPNSFVVEAFVYGEDRYLPYSVGTFSDWKQEIMSNVPVISNNLLGRVVLLVCVNKEFKYRSNVLDLDEIQVDRGYTQNFSDPGHKFIAGILFYRVGIKVHDRVETYITFADLQ